MAEVNLPRWVGCKRYDLIWLINSALAAFAHWVVLNINFKLKSIPRFIIFTLKQNIKNNKASQLQRSVIVLFITITFTR